MITDADVEKIASKVAALLAARPPTGDVLTLEEAIRHTKLGSLRSFRRWLKRWAVRPCAKNRYSRERLDRALRRESQQTYVRPARPAGLFNASFVGD